MTVTVDVCSFVFVFVFVFTKALVHIIVLSTLTPPHPPYAQNTTDSPPASPSVMLSILSEEEQDIKLTEVIRAIRDKGIDVQKPPLLRVNVVILSDIRSHVIFTAHHCLLDGWSVKLVLKDLARRYQLDPASDAFSSLSPTTTYIRYARYERQLLEAQSGPKLGRREHMKTYWKKLLHDVNAPPALLRPTETDTGQLVCNIHQDSLVHRARLVLADKTVMAALATAARDSRTR